MGAASIVLAIIGICSAWIPLWGWGSVLFGILGLAVSIPSITHWHQKPGYTGWGISGLFLGVWSTTLGLAYQTKYTGESLKTVVFTVSLSEVILAWLGAGILTVLGLYLSRVKQKNLGIVIAAVSLLSVIMCSTWGLLSADIAYIEKSGKDTSGTVSP